MVVLVEKSLSTQVAPAQKGSGSYVQQQRGKLKVAGVGRGTTAI